MQNCAHSHPPALSPLSLPPFSKFAKPHFHLLSFTSLLYKTNYNSRHSCHVFSRYSRQFCKSQIGEGMNHVDSLPFYTNMTASAENPFTSESSLSGIAPLEAILFDVDGTLCDSDPLHYYIFREMLQEINFNDGVPITENFFAEKLSGKHNADMALVLFPDDTQQGMKFLDKKEDMFRRLAPEKLKAVKGLYEVKKWVEDHGLKRAAVTNAPRENAEVMISTLGLADFFDVLIIGNECEQPKPHPDPYLKALEALQVSKDHAFVFEDSVSGIKAGVAAGLPVVGLTTGNPEHVLAEAKPALIIKDYSDPKLWAALEEIDRTQDAAIPTV